MPTKIFVGNDIVDLSIKDVLNKSNDKRFISRVLSEEERDSLSKSNSPEMILWMLWSAKEAAFKVLKKLIPNLIFSQVRFVVSLKKGHVEYQKHKIRVYWNYSKEWIHCLAILDIGSKITKSSRIDLCVSRLDKVLNQNHTFSLKESESIYSEQSRGVRMLAKSMLNKYQLSEVEILRLPQDKRFAPPAIYQKDRLLEHLNLSMSHDGSYVSCVISRDDDTPFAC